MDYVENKLKNLLILKKILLWKFQNWIILQFEGKYLVKLEPQFGKCTAGGERTQPGADLPARTGLPGRTLCW